MLLKWVKMLWGLVSSESRQESGRLFPWKMFKYCRFSTNVSFSVETGNIKSDPSGPQSLPIFNNQLINLILDLLNSLDLVLFCQVWHQNAAVLFPTVKQHDLFLSERSRKCSSLRCVGSPAVPPGVSETTCPVSQLWSFVRLDSFQTFTTQETITNAESAKDWFLQTAGDVSPFTETQRRLNLKVFKRRYICLLILHRNLLWPNTLWLFPPTQWVSTTLFHGSDRTFQTGPGGFWLCCCSCFLPNVFMSRLQVKVKDFGIDTANMFEFWDVSVRTLWSN